MCSMSSLAKASADWLIELEPVPEGGLAGTQAMMLELDPRRPQLCIGPRNLTGGGSELWQRAIIRVPLVALPFENTELRDWLKSENVAKLLNQVRLGYRAEMLWSGDFIGHWSEEALQAVDALVAGLGGAMALPS